MIIKIIDVLLDVKVKKCLKVRQELGSRIFFRILKFKFKIQKLKWLKLILGTC